MRVSIDSIKATYGKDLPKIDETLYEGRAYSLAAAKCYAAAYAAAACYRDNMAMQFFRYAVIITNALTPAYPKARSEQGNDIDRSKEEQFALDSELQASQIALASQYGLLTYLQEEAKETPFLFITMYRNAHSACREAHTEAKRLRHSNIDMEFAAVLETAVEAIGVFYNRELAVWTEPVKAAQENRKPALSADVYIASTPEQRRSFSKAEMNKMIAKEQAIITKMREQQRDHHSRLIQFNEEIASQLDVVKEVDAEYEKINEQLESSRKTLETETALLSKKSLERSKLRIELAVVDGDVFRRTERLQTIANLRADLE